LLHQKTITKNKRLKVLVITYDYYPDQSPNTYRWKNVLEVWANRGVEVFVVSAQKNGFSDFENVNGVKVYRTGRSWLEKVKSGILQKTVVASSTESGNVGIAKVSLIRKIHDRTWKKIYFPDFAFLWRHPSQKLAQKLIENENITNLITVSWPFTDHAVGYNLKKKYKINWIADTIDPFYLSRAVNNPFLYSKLNRSYEYRILKQANSITVLTEKLKDKYIELYPALTNNLYVNHNLFIPEIKQSVKVSTTNNICKLVFVGTLSAVTRSPKFLLQLFTQLLNDNDEKIELHLYGNFNDCKNDFLEYDKYINSSIFIYGEISREKVKEVLSGADVLINIGNSNPYQEPSKVIEYMYMLKPILNVCTISDDSAAQVLKDYPLKFNAYANHVDKTNISHIKAFLKTRKTVSELVVRDLTSKYMLEEIQYRYFSLLNNSL
jgi:hypothetical protein